VGYTTQFHGSISVSPPLSAAEQEFLEQFANTRHMARAEGPYFADGKFGHGDNDHNPAIVPDYNEPDRLHPGLWCHWISNDDGTAIEWDEGEKFYHSIEWMRFLIDHFLKPDHIADLPFLQGHTLNGEILAQGEDINDRWKLIVTDNVVTRVDLE
jgi:hypothetical protein